MQPEEKDTVPDAYLDDYEEFLDEDRWKSAADLRRTPVRNGRASRQLSILSDL